MRSGIACKPHNNDVHQHDDIAWRVLFYAMNRSKYGLSCSNMNNTEAGSHAAPKSTCDKYLLLDSNNVNCATFSCFRRTTNPAVEAGSLIQADQ